MLMDDCFLKFQGFHPSEFTRLYLNDKMNVIHEEAPYGATLQATFTKKNQLFKGVVTIYSSSGKFSAVASGSKLKDVTQRLIEKIRGRLDRWKAERYQRPSLEDIVFDDIKSNKEVAYDNNSVA